MQRRSAIALFLLGGSAALSPGLEADQVAFTDTSIIQLIGNRDKYDGKRVRVSGFSWVHYEGWLLYLHQEDYENGLSQNAIWLDHREDVRGSIAAFNMKYIMAVGEFHAGPLGPGAPGEGGNLNVIGGLRHLGKIVLLSDPAHPFALKVKQMLHEK